MGRIQKAYASKYRQLLSQVRARRLDQGVGFLLSQARREQAENPISEAEALESVWRKVRYRLQLDRPIGHQEQAAQHNSDSPPRFLCDAGLGGLARWLRAAGYEACWAKDVADNELLQKAKKQKATILTTDSLLMECRLLRDAIIPSVWVSPTMKPWQQLGVVLKELRLSLREPRCMTCGGQLRPVDKEAVRERIPPRTYQWLDEYFQCRSCNQLFWHGTHWQRIEATLRSANSI